MLRYDIAKTRALGRLETVIEQEFAKIRPVGLKISTKATLIASFVLSALLDLIRRADKYRLDRLGDDNSSGEESSSEVGNLLVWRTPYKPTGI